MSETQELISAPLLEHVVVFEVSIEMGTRVWAWCVVDLARRYGWQRIGWTSVGGAEDLGDLGMSLDWAGQRGGSAPVKVFEYDAPILGES